MTYEDTYQPLPAQLIIKYEPKHSIRSEINIIDTKLDIDGVIHRHNHRHHRTRSIAIKFSKPLYTEI